jgi:DedD protein
MNPGLKQRLVGAVVLIALAVIFLPMLLPGNDGSTMPMFGSNVPDAPKTKFEPIEIPLQLPPAAPPNEVSVVDQPQPGDVASKEKPQLPEEAKPAATAPAASTPPAAPATPAAATSTPPAAHPPANEWAVQLGSFSSSVNALALQEKVRKAGFRAYVEKVKSGQTTSYRVRIGPESSRERADALLKRVQSQLKMKGIVVPHQS